MSNKRITIDDIIKQYIESVDKYKTSYIELEIRFNISSYKIWNNLYNNIYSKYQNNIISKIEESIIIIVDSDNDSKNRKELYFEKGIKKSEKNIKKNKLSRVMINNNIIDYKISLSTEQEI